MSLAALFFLASYAAGLLMAFLRHPIYGLYAYLLAFYLHPPSAWWRDELPDIRWSFVAAALTLIATVIRKRSRQLPPWYNTVPARLLIVYVVWMWIQNAWAVSPTAHWEMCIQFTKYLVLFYLIYTVCRDEKTIMSFSLAHVVGCFYFGWLAFGVEGVGRLESVGGPGVDDANTLGMHLATGVVFAGFLMLILRDWRRWAILLAIPVILDGMILTASRGALVGLLAAGVATWYLKPTAYRKWFYFASVLALILFVRLAGDLLWERMGGTVTALSDEEVELDKSAASRLVIIEGQWRMAKDNPLGVGAHGTSALSPVYISAEYLSWDGVRASHNTPMAVLVNQGFPGILIYLAFVLWIAATLRRLKLMDDLALPSTLGAYRAAIGGALAVVFISGQFSNFFTAEVQIWCIALLAVVSGLAQHAVAMPDHSRSLEHIHTNRP